MKTENEKLGQEPIVPTIFRKVGDNEFRVASERDVNDHHATLIRTEGMSKRFYAACQIAPQIINAMYNNFETHEIIKKTAEKNNIDEADAVAIMAYEFTDKLLEHENN